MNYKFLNKVWMDFRRGEQSSVMDCLMHKNTEVAIVGLVIKVTTLFMTTIGLKNTTWNKWMEELHKWTKLNQKKARQNQKHNYELN